MSYDIASEKAVPCACGEGWIKRITYSNDWNQFKENVFIQCERCQNTHHIESEYFYPKPYHDFTIYYLAENDVPANKIKLDL